METGDDCGGEQNGRVRQRLGYSLARSLYATQQTWNGVQAHSLLLTATVIRKNASQP